MNLTLYSVPCFEGVRVFALVPGLRALQRLEEDDPVWRGPNVRAEWHMVVDCERARVKPSNKIKFWTN